MLSGGQGSLSNPSSRIVVSESNGSNANSVSGFDYFLRSVAAIGATRMSVKVYHLYLDRSFSSRGRGRSESGVFLLQGIVAGCR